MSISHSVPLPGSLGGHHVYRTTHPTFGDVVVKTPHGDASMEHEILAHQAATGIEGVVPLLTATRNPWSIITPYISPAPAVSPHSTCDPRWDAPTADRALAILTKVDAVLPVIPTARIMGEHAGDQAAARRAATHRHADPRMLTAWHTLASYPRPHLRIAHADPRPENWILTPTGPVLLDFGAVALAPPKWDHALFLAHLPALTLTECRDLAHTHHVPWTLVRTAAAAWWALAVDAATSRTALLRDWGQTYAPHFAAFTTRA